MMSEPKSTVKTSPRVLAAGNILRGARCTLKLTITELARIADVDRGTLIALENGGKLSRPEVRLRVQEALERRGVEFTNGDAPGFRLHSVPIVPARC